MCINMALLVKNTTQASSSNTILETMGGLGLECKLNMSIN